MKHACEPSLEVLKSIQKQLKDNPKDNAKKLHAIKKQIARHESYEKAK